MPRLAQSTADGVLYYAINRGNNLAAVFFGPNDYLVFLKPPEPTQRRYPFRRFGYCVMTHPFHLLLSPEPGPSVSRLMQSLTAAHTWHDHRAQATVGHVWQGQFRSPVIEEDDHSLVVSWYIDSLDERKRGQPKKEPAKMN